MMIQPRLLTLGTGLILATAVTAPAAQIRVPADASTIQAAIDGAGAGDVILVSPGTYAEAIDLRGKAVELRSTDGAAMTTIDAIGQDRSAITCDSGEGPGTIIEGFTVTRGTGTVVGDRRKGGGMLNDGSSPTVIGCVFVQNSVSAYSFDIDGSGGGMYNDHAHPTVIDTAFLQNNLYGCSGYLNGGAGMYNDASSPMVSGCTFIANGGNNGGGMMNIRGSEPTVVNSLFSENGATYSGGGMNCTDDSLARITNCRFTGNLAYHGGAIYTTSSGVDLRNCTVAMNHATKTGGGLYTMFSVQASNIVNSIIWGNDADEFPSTAQIDRYGGFWAEVRYSIVDGGWSGEGNRGDDPRFVDPIGADGIAGTVDDDLSLAVSSPALDAGDVSALPADVTDVDGDGDSAETIPLDRAGSSRVSGLSVDMGDVEQATAGCPEDLDGDGFIGFGDLLTIVYGWGACPTSGPCPGDIDGDGHTGFDDLMTVVSAWGDCLS